MVIVYMLWFVGTEAAAASLHAAEDSGTKTGLPRLHDHHDLHATEGGTSGWVYLLRNFLLHLSHLVCARVCVRSR